MCDTWAGSKGRTVLYICLRARAYPYVKRKTPDKLIAYNKWNDVLSMSLSGNLVMVNS